jgi:hypothetical protein
VVMVVDRHGWLAQDPGGKVQRVLRATTARLVERVMSHISRKVPARIRPLVEGINRGSPECIRCGQPLAPDEIVISESGARYCAEHAPPGRVE